MHSENHQHPRPQQTSQNAFSQDIRMDDLPKMTEELDAYLAGLVKKVEDADLRASNNMRTSDYTVVNFAETKQDRLWAMKLANEFIDSILITADGHREVT